MCARCLEQLKRAFDVGAHEGGGPVDAAVDVAFGGEMHHRARLVLGEQTIEQRAIADVATHEVVALVVA